MENLNVTQIVKSRAAYTCSKCGSLDHTARNHDRVTNGAPATIVKTPSLDRACKLCRCSGHYAKTCPTHTFLDITPDHIAFWAVD